MPQQAILVIKHGALGDMILATSAFEAIRAYHPDQTVVLLTNQAYVALAKAMPFFDEIWTDNRPKPWQPKACVDVWRKLRGRHGQGYAFTRVYDLQCSGRTSWYYRLLRPKPQWFGAAPGCAMPRPFASGECHVLDGFVRHFAAYGMKVEPRPSLDWLQASLADYQLPQRYVVLVAGCSPKHRRKHWTSSGFAEVIMALSEKRITTVFTGAAQDAPLYAAIKQRLTTSTLVIDAVGQSPLPVLAEMSRHAMAVLGVDTGPTHLAAAVGAPTVVLFSSFRAPRLVAPCGPCVQILQREDLNDLAAVDVLKVLYAMLSHGALAVA
jgi:ADP-heptose:LPS heptosyltransferase